LLDALDRWKLAENTLVVLFSDNGGTQHGGGSNRPLRATKSTTFEGGIRVPFAMRWPKRLAAGRTYPHRISTLDLLPTCLDAAGIPAGRSPKLDGESFLPAVASGVPSPTDKRPLFWLFRDNWAVMSGDWKLVNSRAPGGARAYQIVYSGDPAHPKPALFNLAQDPGEQHDVSDKHPEVARRLQRLFNEWREETRRDATSAPAHPAAPKP
jgi:arylsulfatase A-like enzyme